MVCWNFQITKQTIEHKLWALSRYKKSPLYKRIKTIRAISCIGIMLFLAGLEIYEVLFHYTPKPHIIFGFAIADFIIMFDLEPYTMGNSKRGTFVGHNLRPACCFARAALYHNCRWTLSQLQ